MEELDNLHEESVFTFGNLWTVAKKKLMLIISLIVAFAAVGALYSFFFVPQEYTATASLIVSVDPEKTTKTITVSDGKTYTIVDDNDINAENVALSYACTIAGNALTFFSEDNDFVYLDAVNKYKTNYKSKEQSDEVVIKLKGVKKSLTVSSQSSQIFLAYKSSMKDPDKMLGCIIDSFMEKINEKNEDGTPVFQSFAGRISVLSEPYLNETNGRLGQVIEYTLVFALIGLAVSICIVLVVTYKTFKNDGEQKAE